MPSDCFESFFTYFRLPYESSFSQLSFVCEITLGLRFGQFGMISEHIFRSGFLVIGCVLVDYVLGLGFYVIWIFFELSLETSQNIDNDDHYHTFACFCPFRTDESHKFIKCSKV